MSPDNPPTSPAPVEAVEVQKSGLSDQEKEFLKGLGMSPEDMNVLEGDMPKGLQEDIMRLMRDPSLKAEKQRFVEKYIYERIIQQMKEGETIVNAAKRLGYTDPDFIFGLGDYITEKNKRALAKKDQENEGKRQAVIAEDKANEGVRQENAEKERRKQKLEETLAELNKPALSSLDPKGSSLLTEGVTSLKQDASFLQRMEDQGYPKEEVQSGKWDQTLTGYYLAERGSTLSQYVIPEKRGAYEESLGKIRATLGIQKAPEIERFLSDSMVSGDRKVATLETTARLVRSGRYDVAETTYDARTGLITLPSRDGRESAQIDTSRTPPSIEYRLENIWIRDELRPMSKAMREYSESIATEKKEMREVAGKYGLYIDQLSGEKAKPLTKAYEFGGLEKDRSLMLERFGSGNTPSERLEAVRGLIILNTRAESERRKALTPENMGDIGELEGPLAQEGLSLRELATSLEKYIATQTSVIENALELRKNGENRENTPTIREATIRGNLIWLTGDQADLDKLGNTGNTVLYRILTDINKDRDTSNQIDLTKPLDKKSQDTIIARRDTLLTSLGYDRGVLRSDQVGDLQKDLGRIISIPSGSTGSIETLSRATPKGSSEQGK